MSRHSSRGNDWDKTRQIVLARYNFECAVCGSDERLTVDHIVPKARGGTDELDNLRVLCLKCNAKKGDRLDKKESGFVNPRYFPNGPIRRPG